MKQIIIAGTIALLAAVGLGTAFGQDSVLQAVTASDPLSQLTRVVLIGLLVSLLVTSPPRSMDFRTTLIVASAVLTIGVSILLSQYVMGPVDALIYVEVAIIFAIEGMEMSAVTKKQLVKPAAKYLVENNKVAN